MRYHLRFYNSQIRSTRNQTRNTAWSRGIPKNDPRPRKIKIDGINPVWSSTAQKTHLTCVGKNLSSADALKWGLVSEVFETPDKCISAALDLAESIAGYSPLAVAAAKEAVNGAFEMGLGRGLEMERRLFWGSFATEDRRIGMDAFVNKEKPKWVGK